MGFAVSLAEGASVAHPLSDLHFITYGTEIVLSPKSCDNL